MPFVGRVPFVGGTGTELFPGTTTDEVGTVEEAGMLMGNDEEETPVLIGAAMLELIPVPTGAVLAGQNPFNQPAYCAVSLAAQL